MLKSLDVMYNASLDERKCIIEYLNVPLIKSRVNIQSYHETTERNVASNLCGSIIVSFRKYFPLFRNF